MPARFQHETPRTRIAVGRAAARQRAGRSHRTTAAQCSSATRAQVDARGHPTLPLLCTARIDPAATPVARSRHQCSPRCGPLGGSLSLSFSLALSLALPLFISFSLSSAALRSRVARFLRWCRCGRRSSLSLSFSPSLTLPLSCSCCSERQRLNEFLVAPLTLLVL